MRSSVGRELAKTVSVQKQLGFRNMHFYSKYISEYLIKFIKYICSGTYIELLESTDFKVSGECQLKAGEDPYVGHFMVGLAKDHNMGKVKAAKSPPHEESEEDFTCHLPGIMTPIARGGKMWFWFGFGSYKMYLVWIDEPKPFSNHILINVVMVLV